MKSVENDDGGDIGDKNKNRVAEENENNSDVLPDVVNVYNEKERTSEREGVRER